jgi:ABC-type amino acid transport substrate-binding protein
VFRRLRTSIAVVLALVASSCSTQTSAGNCTGTKPDLRQTGTLTVAADLTYPPFAYDRPRTIPAGFEADLVRALADVMKMDVLIVNRATSALVTGLLGHRHDLAAAGLHDTKELRSETCVSTPYMDADLGVLVSSPDPHNISDPGDLNERQVGVLDGSRAEQWARDNLPDSIIRSLPADGDLLDALEARDVDGVIEEVPIARYAATQSHDVKVAAVISTGEHYVLAAAPDNGALMTKVNRALDRLGTSGRLAKLKAKWFGG